MGNLSNPVINRLGINTFWNTLWVTTANYARHVQQQKLVSYLLFIIVYYGLYNYNLFFINKYWFLFYFYDYKKNTLHNFLYYYRYQLLKNKYNNADISYLIRIKRLIIYPMRLWILRYQGWLVINWFIFQPIKLNAVTFAVKKQLDLLSLPSKFIVYLKRLHYLTYLYYFTKECSSFYYNF